MTLLAVGKACLVIAAAIALIMVLDGIAWAWDRGTDALAQWFIRRDRQRRENNRG